jgi:hypothetical protein
MHFNREVLKVGQREIGFEVTLELFIVIDCVVHVQISVNLYKVLENQCDSFMIWGNEHVLIDGFQANWLCYALIFFS